ncbi:MAG: thioredoxin family protein [Patescibacteria group bacterium]|nr:thioredoxin family protein [Patescibacteria group bacterium]
MKIQVLGSGCPTCEKLYKITRQAVEQMGLPDQVEYIKDIQQILNMGLMSSPVLAVNGKPALVGFIPKIEEIKKAIQKSISQ